MQQPFGEGKTCDPYMNGRLPPGEGIGVSGSGANSPATMGPPESRPPKRPSPAAATKDAQVGPGAIGGSLPNRQSGSEIGPSSPPKGPARRKLTRDEMIALRRQEGKEPSVQRSTEKDCFIIPQGNLERFLPDGITVKNLFYILIV